MVYSHVYCLAIDARPKWGDVVTGRKYPSLLEGFPDGHSINGSPETSCINRKGFLLFLSYGLTGPVSVLSVQSVVKLRRNILRTDSSQV